MRMFSSIARSERHSSQGMRSTSLRSHDPANCFTYHPASRSIPMPRLSVRDLVLEAFGLTAVCLTSAAHKAIGKALKGFGAQAKIHTRNDVGSSGKIYFGTKQGYSDTAKGEKREDYPGGYPMVYDPKTGETKVYPIPVPYEGINSITPDESGGVAYISTCSDH